MIEENEHFSNLNPRFFSMRFFNPSPGNPIINSMNFDEDFVYAYWSDGCKTKTKIDKIKIEYDKDNEQLGITLWFGGYSLFLSKEENDVQEEQEFSDGDDSVDEDEGDYQ